MTSFVRKFYAALILLFLYLPIGVLIVFSFNASKSRASWDGFTLRWYEELLGHQMVADALSNTLIVAAGSAVIATIIGTAAAFAMYQGLGCWEKRIVMNLTYLPVLNPDIVTGLSLMLLFIFCNMKLGLMTLMLSHTIFNVPYVVLTVLPKLKQLDKSIYEAALDLGATPAYAFRHIVFPAVLPGVITGLLFAFTLSLDDFVISFFTTGSGVNNLSIMIYSMARRGIHPTINALSTLLFLVVLALLLAVNRRLDSDRNK